MTVNKKSKLEDRLSGISGFEHSVLTGSGTTAIWALLSAYGFRGKLIAIPDNTCPSILMAILFSGNEPYYLDIDAGSGCIDSNKFSGVFSPDIAAVIYPYMYGQNTDISGVAACCRKKKWVLIADYAQAFGIQAMKESAGIDAAILSFGTGKIIEAGHGGAVQVKSTGLKKRIDKILGSDKYLESEPANLSPTFSQVYKFFYNNVRPEGFRHFRGAFRELFKSYRNDFLVRLDSRYLGRIDSGLNDCCSNLDRRSWLADEFQSLFSGVPGIKCMKQPKGSVQWRYNIFLKKDVRDALLKEMLSKRFPVSSWFSPLSYIYPSVQDGLPRRTSKYFADTILNLWLDEKVDLSYCRKAAGFITGFAGAANEE